MDRVKNNPRMPFTQSIDRIPAPTTGTVGVSERIVVETINNTPDPIDAPTNRFANWSAENPYDK